MTDKLDVIILDDDPLVCSLMTHILEGFYVWGDIHSFTDYRKALSHCKKTKVGVAIFILDVFLEKETAFNFLDKIADKFTWASEDTIIVTGNASDDIVNMCISANIAHLLEKPIKPYALKLAVRAIIQKYILFARRMLQDPDYAKRMASL
jgi:DNA-binding NtrC family response regulator